MKLPESWREVRLGDILHRVETKVDPQRAIALTHFYVGLEHIESHTGRLLREAEDVTDSTDILSIKTAFQKGDLLYGKLRPNLNKVHLADQGGICSTDIWALRAGDELNPEFGLHFLRSPAIHVRASQLAAGANLPRVSAESFDRISFPLPTLPEQQRIVDVLRQAEELRELKAKAMKLVAEAGKALFEQHFGVVGATTAWPMESFGKHITYSKYGPRFPDQPYSEGGIHILRTTDMNDDGTIRWWESPKLALTAKQIEEHALKPGTLVISRSGSIGPFALFDGESQKCVAGAYLIEFGIADTVDPEYVRALFATPYVQQMLKKAVRSVAQPNINAPNIQAIQIPVPPIGLQKEFAVQIKALRACSGELKSSVTKVDNLISAASVAAFTGQLTSHWRDSYQTEVAEAANARDVLLRERGAKLASRPSGPAPLAPVAKDNQRPARQWLLAELSEFQRQVLAAFSAYPEQPLLVEDADVFARFCDDENVLELLKGFGLALNDRIRRTLSQLSALGLIAKLTLPKQNPQTGERDYLKAFRPLREDEFTKMADVETLRRALSSNDAAVRHYFTVVLDYETSERAGAGGMFQVAALSDEDDKDRTDLVDQGKHYAALDELINDIARRLGVRIDQIELEK